MRNERLIQIVISKHILFESYNVNLAHQIEMFKTEKNVQNSMLEEYDANELNDFETSLVLR